MMKHKQDTIKNFYRSLSTKRRKAKAPLKKPKLKKVSALVAHTQNNTSSKSSSEGFQIQSNIQKNVSSIRNVLGNEKLQNEVIDKISSRQKQFQELLLPEWLRNPFQDRERKPGVIVMDRWWYTWNIASAFVPGLMILLLTQYYKGEARAFYENQQKKDRERLMEGKSTDEQGTIVVSNDEHDNKSLGNLSTVYILDAVKSIFGFNEALSKDQEESTIAQTEMNTGPTSMEIQQISSSEPPTMDELRQRIEYLESQLNIHSQDNSHRQQHQHEYQHQSGIRRRIDERKRKRFLDEDRIKQQQQEEAMTNNLDTNVPRTVADALKIKIKDFMEARRLEVSNVLWKESQEEEIKTSSNDEPHDMERLHEEKVSNDQDTHKTKKEYNNDGLNHNNDIAILTDNWWIKLTRIWKRTE